MVKIILYLIYGGVLGKSTQITLYLNSETNNFVKNPNQYGKGPFISLENKFK